MDIQRLRNLTTGILHTEMGHIYEDIEYLTGTWGVMTHSLPNASRALEPYLREKIKDERFWDGKFDNGHIGEFDVRPMNAEETEQFWERFNKLPSPLEGKKVVVLKTA